VTSENRSANAAAELAVAEEDLASARSSAEHGFFRAAVSRAYFAAFHAARALLLTRGLEPRSHKGARHLLNRHFVRTGELDRSFDRLLAYAEKDREDADYAPAVAFSAEEAAERIDTAERLVDEARRRCRA